MIDIIGWLGSAMVVIAYALNITKKLLPDSMAYFILNIAGSVCLIANTVYHNAIPSAAVNIVWIAIAVFALIKKKKMTAS
jgi:hypothetical protein